MSQATPQTEFAPVPSQPEEQEIPMELDEPALMVPSSQTEIQVARGFVRLWKEAGNSKLQAQFTLADGSHRHFLGHFNPPINDFECHDAMLQYSNRKALTASHKFYGKMGTSRIFIAIGDDDGSVVEGQLFRMLNPASRVVGFGSWFENMTESPRSVPVHPAGVETAPEIAAALCWKVSKDLRAPQIAFSTANVRPACFQYTRGLTFKTVLNELKAVSTAVFDAQPQKGCMKDTRVAVLAQLAKWAQDASTPPVFWLTGMAGTGKTSIALSFCKALAEEADLGGSFFCSRTSSSVEQTDVRRIVPTLVRLLARKYPDFAAAVVAQLEADPDISQKTVATQVDQLLRRTLATLPSGLQTPLVLVVDALDECSNAEAAVDFIYTLIDLTRSSALAPFPVKLFVTSRPESHIRRTALRHVDPSAVMVLHEIDPEEVSSDIFQFIQATFATAPLDLTDPSRSSNGTWYNISDITSLTTRANGLFIFASTAVRFILEKGFAAGRTKRLRDVVDLIASPCGTTEPLDRMYEVILTQSLRSFEKDERMDLQLLLAQLLALREPLSVRAFAELVKISEAELRSVLETLHSVINVPADSDAGHLRTLHASFGDFLQHRAPEGLRIDIAGGRGLLLRACCDRMQANDLCFNVSRSTSSYQRNPDGRPAFIPWSLEYACLQWAFHLGEVETPAPFELSIEAVFVPKFLFWLEVVIVVQRVDDGLRALAFAESLVSSEEVKQFLRDSRAFIAFSRDAIEASAPHIYLSALPFTSRGSTVISKLGHLFIRLPQAQVLGRATTETTVLRGHQLGVRALASSPDKHFLVSGSFDKTVRIWDLRTGRQAQPAFTGHTDWVYAVAFSPDGSQVISGSKDGTLRVWDLCARESLVIQTGSPVQAVAFSPDGSLVAAGLADCSVRIGNTRTRLDEFQLLSGHSGTVNAVAFSPDGRTLASASADGTIRLWNTETRQQIRGPLEGHMDEVSCVSFSPDGRSLASGSEDCTICIWEVLTGEERSRFEGHTDLVWSVSYSPDGARIVSGSGDQRYAGVGTVCVCDANNGREICAPIVTGRGDVWAVVFLNPDTVASATDDGNIYVWDLRNSQRQIKPLTGGNYLSCVAISADGTWIASGSLEAVSIWHSSTGNLKLPPIEIPDVDTVTFSPDGTRIAAGSMNGSVDFIDTRTGQITEFLKNSRNRVRSVSFSPNGEWLLEASGADSLCIWNAHTSELLLRLKGHSAYVSSALFSPDGAYIASGSDDQTVAIWDASTGRLTMPLLRGHSSGVLSVDFSPDGMSVASGSDDGTIRIWQSATGECLRVIQVRKVCVIAFSPNGKWIVSGSNDSTVRLWSASDGAQLRSFDSLTSGITSVAFTPDSSSIVFGSGDGTIQVSSLHDAPHAVHRDLRMSDRWIVSPNGEPLMWIPHDCREWLELWPCKLLIAAARVTVNLEGSARGLDWTQIYRG